MKNSYHSHRLLILTQKVDKTDPILGFFHDWVEKLAAKFEKVSVVCLQEGEYNLPENVSVYSLGKKKRKLPVLSRTKYLTYFYRYILGLHADYDVVFVHMNQEYVILGGFLWWVMRKKVYLWRNHAKGGLLTRLAIFFSHKVFYTSSVSFTARFKKAIKMPVGINTEIFKLRAKSLELKEQKNRILSLGRISPVKNVHIIIEAARILKEEGINFSLDVIGDPVNPEDMTYKQKLVADNKDLIGARLVNFSQGVPNDKTPGIYADHEIFVNLTSAGSFDKTILESVACGCLPVVTNTALDNVFREFVVEGDSRRVAEKIKNILNQDQNWKEKQKTKLQKYTLENHSLNALIGRLCIEIKGSA